MTVKGRDRRREGKEESELAEDAWEWTVGRTRRDVLSGGKFECGLESEWLRGQSLVQLRKK